MSAPVDVETGVAIAVAILLGGLALIGIVRWARQVEGRLLAIEALIHDARTREPTPHDRLVSAAINALAAYRAIFRTCWNDRDQRAFAELEAALEEVLPQTGSRDP